MPKRVIRRRPQKDTKFTRHTRGRFYDALRSRIPPTRAASVAGVSKDAYMAWMRIGRDEPDTHPIHAQFRRRVIKIRAEMEGEALAIIRRAGVGGKRVVETTVKMSSKGPEVIRTVKRERGQWQAAAWYLERGWPEDYAQRYISPDGDVKSAKEQAAEIRGAFNAMMDSVPIGEGDAS